MLHVLRPSQTVSVYETMRPSIVGLPTFIENTTCCELCISCSVVYSRVWHAYSLDEPHMGCLTKYCSPYEVCFPVNIAFTRQNPFAFGYPFSAVIRLHNLQDVFVKVSSRSRWCIPIAHEQWQASCFLITGSFFSVVYYYFCLQNLSLMFVSSSVFHFNSGFRAL